MAGFFDILGLQGIGLSTVASITAPSNRTLEVFAERTMKVCKDTSRTLEVFADRTLEVK